MVIRVANITDKEVLCYPWPTIKGEITPSCTCTTLCVSNLIGDCQLMYWPISRGRFFKVVVSLHVGSNSIQLACLHNRVQLTLFYKPSSRTRRVRLVYIISKDGDGQFQAPDGCDSKIESAIDRIITGARILQSFVAEKLCEENLSRRTFQLIEDAELLPLVYLHRSNLTTDQCLAMSGDSLWVHFAKELALSLASDLGKIKWLAFMSFTRYCLPDGASVRSHQDVMKYTSGHCALGGGGLALFGSGSLHTWASCLEEFPACITDCRTIDRSRFMDDSAFRGYYWSNYATGLGSVLHELGHTFDLSHTQEGIMFRGGDDLNLAFCFPMQGYSTCPKCSGRDGASSPFEEYIPSPNNNRHLDLIQIETGFRLNRVLKFEPQAVSPGCTKSDNRGVVKTPSTLLHNHNGSKNRWGEFGFCTSLFHDGRAYWTRSNALLLASHKWFMEDNEISSETNEPALKLSRNIIKSKFGLCVMEARHLSKTQKVSAQTFGCRPSISVVSYLEFSRREPVYSLELNQSKLRKLRPSNARDIVLVIGDIQGNIVKVYFK